MHQQEPKQAAHTGSYARKRGDPGDAHALAGRDGCNEQQKRAEEKRIGHHFRDGLAEAKVEGLQCKADRHREVADAKLQHVTVFAPERPQHKKCRRQNHRQHRIEKRNEKVLTHCPPECPGFTLE